MALALFLQQTTVQTSPPNAAELKEQIRQTVLQAREAALQAAADAKAAQAAQGGGGHNIVVPLPPIPPIGGTTTSVPYDRDIPPRVASISIAFFLTLAFMVVGLPLARAIARRIDKGSTAPPAIPKEMRDQLQQISQSVDAIAIEVERISEGQRFTTKMLADKRPQDITVLPGSTGQ